MVSKTCLKTAEIRVGTSGWHIYSATSLGGLSLSDCYRGRTMSYDYNIRNIFFDLNPTIGTWERVRHKQKTFDNKNIDSQLEINF